LKNLKGNKQPGKPRYRWGNNIKMNIKNIERECGVDLSGSKYGPTWAFVSTVTNLLVP
jgi:hypothetical protein